MTQSASSSGGEARGSSEPEPGIAPARWSLLGVVALGLDLRRWVIVSAIAMASILVVHGVLSPRTYTSRAVVVPEVQSSGTASLGGLASRLGVSLPSGGFERSLQYFAAMARSKAVARRVVDVQLHVNDGDDERSSVTLVEFWDVDGESKLERVELAARQLLRRLRVSANIETSALTIEVPAESPMLAKQMVSRIVFLLDSMNVETRRLRSSAERKFLDERVALAKSELESAEQALAQFVTSNRLYEGSAALRLSYERLLREVQGAQSLWLSLSESRESARLGEVRGTPTIIPAEPPTVPALPDSRRMLLRAVVGVIVGALLPILLVMLRNWWHQSLARNPTEASKIRRAFGRPSAGHS